MSRTLTALAAILIIAGCSTPVNVESERENMLEADRAFSRFSVESGMYEAFDKYMADSAMILRNGAHPIVGREKIRELLTPPPEGTLKWEPVYSDIAASGDLGYTVGRYSYSVVDSAGEATSSGGYYVTIWRKQADGSWKYVFDTGTQGLPED